MPEEPQGQAELEPGEVAATPTEEAPAEPQAVDYAALEAKVAELGEGYSLTNIYDKVSDLRKGMNEAQRKAVEIERKYEPVQPLVEKLQTDPAFAAKLQGAAHEYFSGGDYDTTNTEIPQEVSKTLDPLYQKISNMEVQLAGERMDREIDLLKNQGMPIDDEVKNQIYQRVVDTRSEDVKAHAWAILGPKMVEQASKQAKTEVTEKIKGNSQKYIPTPGGSTSGKPYDVTQMSKEEIDADMMRELEERMTS
jgi:hypothetical protein